MNLMRKAAPLGWFFLAILCAGAIAVGSIAWFFVTIPDATDLNKCLTAQMFEVRLCKDDSSYAPLRSISPNMRNAVIVSEDAAFWDHKGIDWIELRKSFETNLEKGRMARGGSTITQQLAKNVYLSSEKSLLRKIREAVIAIRIERLYDKNFILEKYLNVVEFDKDIYGVKAASKHYFQVSAANLSIAQAAWLAFLLPNPKKYSVSFHKNRLTPFAFKQMSEIIDRLARFKRISEPERREALREARAFFGGVSGESLELEEEFDSGGSEENSGESSGTHDGAQDLQFDSSSRESDSKPDTRRAARPSTSELTHEPTEETAAASDGSDDQPSDSTAGVPDDAESASE